MTKPVHLTGAQERTIATRYHRSLRAAAWLNRHGKGSIHQKLGYTRSRVSAVLAGENVPSIPDEHKTLIKRWAARAERVKDIRDRNSGRAISREYGIHSDRAKKIHARFYPQSVPVIPKKREPVREFLRMKLSSSPGEVRTYY